MPTDLWTEAGRMAACGLAVAAVAAPAGALGFVLAWRAGAAVVPRPAGWRVRWTGFEVFVAFLVLMLVVPALVFESLSRADFFRQVYGPDFPVAGIAPPVEASAAVAGVAAAGDAHGRLAILSAVRGLWVGLVSLPLQLGAILLARATLFPPHRSPAEPGTIPARVALAAVAWAVLTPPVLAINVAANAAFAWLGWPVGDHPLARLSAARPASDQALFFFQAGVAAPLVEELLFRGVLLGWLVGGRSLADPPPAAGHARPRPAADRRVWPVLVVAVGVAVCFAWQPGEWAAVAGRGPVLFAGGLLGGWVVLRRVVRKRRTAGAVYASAALFAAVHSAVWPSPVPLFALGLGLGWLAVRTRGVLAPVIVHGLFNTVSVLFVLRGPA